jgi:hypothetical protein
MCAKRNDRKEWSMLQFSQANPRGSRQEDVPALLVRVARSMKSLGAVHVHDIICHDEVDEKGRSSPTMLVYVSRDHDSPESA